ncbi:hypothetical protein FRC07_001403, partial [Ceratobasidium sp. 392]
MSSMVSGFVQDLARTTIPAVVQGVIPTPAHTPVPDFGQAATPPLAKVAAPALMDTTTLTPVEAAVLALVKAAISALSPGSITIPTSNISSTSTSTSTSSSSSTSTTTFDSIAPISTLPIAPALVPSSKATPTLTSDSPLASTSSLASVPTQVASVFAPKLGVAHTVTPSTPAPAPPPDTNPSASTLEPVPTLDAPALDTHTPPACVVGSTTPLTRGYAHTLESNWVCDLPPAPEVGPVRVSWTSVQSQALPDPMPTPPSAPSPEPITVPELALGTAPNVNVMARAPGKGNAEKGEFANEDQSKAVNRVVDQVDVKQGEVVERVAESICVVRSEEISTNVIEETRRGSAEDSNAGEVKSVVPVLPAADHGSRLGYTTKVIEETDTPVITAYTPSAATKEKSGEHVQRNTAASDYTSAPAPSSSQSRSMEVAFDPSQDSVPKITVIPPPRSSPIKLLGLFGYLPSFGAPPTSVPTTTHELGPSLNTVLAPTNAKPESEVKPGSKAVQVLGALSKPSSGPTPTQVVPAALIDQGNECSYGQEPAIAGVSQADMVSEGVAAHIGEAKSKGRESGGKPELKEQDQTELDGEDKVNEAPSAGLGHSLSATTKDTEEERTALNASAPITEAKDDRKDDFILVALSTSEPAITPTLDTIPSAESMLPADTVCNPAFKPQQTSSPGPDPCIDAPSQPTPSSGLDTSSKVTLAGPLAPVPNTVAGPPPSPTPASASAQSNLESTPVLHSACVGPINPEPAPNVAPGFSVSSKLTACGTSTQQAQESSAGGSDKRVNKELLNLSETVGEIQRHTLVTSVEETVEVNLTRCEGECGNEVMTTKSNQARPNDDNKADNHPVSSSAGLADALPTTMGDCGEVKNATIAVSTKTEENHEASAVQDTGLATAPIPEQPLGAEVVETCPPATPFFIPALDSAPAVLIPAPALGVCHFLPQPVPILVFSAPAPISVPDSTSSNAPDLSMTKLPGVSAPDLAAALALDPTSTAFNDSLDRGPTSGFESRNKLALGNTLTRDSSGSTLSSNFTTQVFHPDSPNVPSRSVKENTSSGSSSSSDLGSSSNSDKSGGECKGLGNQKSLLSVTKVETNANASKLPDVGTSNPEIRVGNHNVETSARKTTYTESNTVSINTFSKLSVTTYLSGSGGVDMTSSVSTNASTPGETKLNKASKSEIDETVDKCDTTIEIVNSILKGTSQPLVPVPEVVLVSAHDSAPTPTDKSCQISSSRVSIGSAAITSSADSTPAVAGNSSCGQTVALGLAPGRPCVPAPVPCPTPGSKLKCQDESASTSAQTTQSQSICRTTHYTDCKGPPKDKVKKDIKADCAPAPAKEPNSRTSAEKCCPPKCEPTKTKQDQQKQDGCENDCKPSSASDPPVAPGSASANCQKTDNTDCKGPAKDKAKKDTKTDCAPTPATNPISTSSTGKCNPGKCEPKTTKQDQQKRGGCENECQPSSTSCPPVAPCSTSASCQKTDNTDCKGPVKDQPKKDTKADCAPGPASKSTSTSSAGTCNPDKCEPKTTKRDQPRPCGNRNVCDKSNNCDSTVVPCSVPAKDPCSTTSREPCSRPNPCLSSVTGSTPPCPPPATALDAQPTPTCEPGPALPDIRSQNSATTYNVKIVTTVARSESRTSHGIEHIAHPGPSPTVPISHPGLPIARPRISANRSRSTKNNASSDSDDSSDSSSSSDSSDSSDSDDPNEPDGEDEARNQESVVTSANVPEPPSAGMNVAGGRLGDSHGETSVEDQISANRSTTISGGVNSTLVVVSRSAMSAPEVLSVPAHDSTSIPIHEPCHRSPAPSFSQSSRFESTASSDLTTESASCPLVLARPPVPAVEPAPAPIQTPAAALVHGPASNLADSFPHTSTTISTAPARPGGALGLALKFALVPAGAAVHLPSSAPASSPDLAPATLTPKLTSAPATALTSGSTITHKPSPASVSVLAPETVNVTPALDLTPQGAPHGGPSLASSACASCMASIVAAPAPAPACNPAPKPKFEPEPCVVPTASSVASGSSISPAPDVCSGPSATPPAPSLAVSSAPQSNSRCSSTQVSDPKSASPAAVTLAPVPESATAPIRAPGTVQSTVLTSRPDFISVCELASVRLPALASASAAKPNQRPEPDFAPVPHTSVDQGEKHPSNGDILDASETKPDTKLEELVKQATKAAIPSSVRNEGNDVKGSEGKKVMDLSGNAEANAVSIQTREGVMISVDNMPEASEKPFEPSDGPGAETKGKKVGWGWRDLGAFGSIRALISFTKITLAPTVLSTLTSGPTSAPKSDTASAISSASVSVLVVESSTTRTSTAQSIAESASTSCQTSSRTHCQVSNPTRVSTISDPIRLPILASVPKLVPSSAPVTETVSAKTSAAILQHGPNSGPGPAIGCGLASAAAPDLIPALGPTSSTSAHTPDHGTVLACDSIPQPVANPVPVPASTRVTTQKATVGQTSRTTNKGFSSTGKVKPHANVAATIAQIESKCAHSGSSQNRDTSGDWNEVQRTAFRTGSSVKELAKLAHITTNVHAGDNTHVGVKDAKGKGNILGTVAHAFNTSKEMVEEQVWRGFGTFSNIQPTVSTINSNLILNPPPTHMPLFIIGSAFGSVLSSISTHGQSPNTSVAQIHTSFGSTTSYPASSSCLPTPARVSSLTPDSNPSSSPTPALSHATVSGSSINPGVVRTTTIQTTPNASTPSHSQVLVRPSSPGSTIGPAPACASVNHPEPTLVLDVEASSKHPVVSASGSALATTSVPVQDGQAVTQTSTVRRHKTNATFSSVREVESHVEKDRFVTQTGEALLANRGLSQQTNWSTGEATAAKATWTESKEGAKNATPAVTSAEERFDLDFIVENPVRWTNTSSNVSFALDDALERTSAKRVWRNSELIASHTHGSTLAPEQLHCSDSVSNVASVSASTASTVSSPEPALVSNRGFDQAVYTAQVSKLAPIPAQPTAGDAPSRVPIPDLERARVQTLTTTPMRMTVHAPIREFSPDPFVGSNPAPTSTVDSFSAHTPMQVVTSTPVSEPEPTFSPIF